ncbi:hypothetical protein AK812_SmicGene45070, partial [Symbiodinium microadriaticum]
MQWIEGFSFLDYLGQTQLCPYCNEAWRTTIDWVDEMLLQAAKIRDRGIFVYVHASGVEQWMWKMSGRVQGDITMGDPDTAGSQELGEARSAQKFDDP